ncbi:MAG TPA: hypothetical protein EYH36_00895 [Desulfocapsa sulfexigens]|nr:hypothetical protein [Desulfocapsa sulfexigens]HIQ36549.1 hypothetical protein [Desulfocapsa sulfexigens]
MNQLEKLQVLLPHWIEHNRGHAEECRKWATDVDNKDVQLNLNAALAAMEVVTNHLEKALGAAGGPGMDGADDGHHHH